jgi:hypothetical protein
MEGYVNSGFSNSLTSSSSRFFSTKNFSLDSKREEFKSCEQLENGPLADPDTDLDSDSFLSDLEKDSARGKETFVDGEDQTLDWGLKTKPEILHGYSDRSFEGAILTFTNGEASTMADHQGQAQAQERRVQSMSDMRQPIVQHLSGRGSKRFTPRSAPPPPIPEEVEDAVLTRHGDGRISMKLSMEEKSIRGSESSEHKPNRRPEAKLTNLFGLIDTRKISSLLGYTNKSPRPQPEFDTIMGRCSGEMTSETYHPQGVPPQRTTRQPEGKGPLLTGMDIACLAGMWSLVLLVISMAAPFWLVSWEDTQSPFVRLGPWEACFNRFRYPKLQFDVLFDGCHAIWGYEYRLIREWLMPPWFLAVQGLLIISLIFCLFSRCLTIPILFKAPQTVFLRFGSQFLMVCAGCDLFSGLLLFVCSMTFAGSCWARSWLLYPNWNYLSWGWAAGLLASWSHLATAGLMYVEARKEMEKRTENENLLLQLEPAPIFNPDSQGFYI